MRDRNRTAPAHPTEANRPTEHSGAQAEAPASADELTPLRVQLDELQRERDHLVATVDILQGVSASLHFVDILQTIARKLGDAFGLDRCAIFLTGDQGEVRLVASYEDPSIRNLVVDVNRYPELQRAFETGEIVFIPDAPSDPMFKAVRTQLEMRNVRSIVVVPLHREENVIGVIFLRTDRDAKPFSDADLKFCQVVASLTAKALWNAHRFESLMRQQQDLSAMQRKAELQRIALVAFLRRLLDHHAKAEGQTQGEARLPQASIEELDRLVAVAMQVFEEESKG